MAEYFLTFGVKYHHEPHPHWAGVNPNGYVVITAPDYVTARALAHRFFGLAWSFLTPGEQFPEAENVARFYPAGRIGTIDPDWNAVSLVEGVEPPTPIAETRKHKSVLVSWYQTEHYTAEVEVDDDFDLEEDNVDERLMDLINDLSSEQMDRASVGVIDKEITDKEMYS